MGRVLQFLAVCLLILPGVAWASATSAGPAPDPCGAGERCFEGILSPSGAQAGAAGVEVPVDGTLVLRVAGLQPNDEAAIHLILNGRLFATVTAARRQDDELYFDLSKLADPMTGQAAGTTSDWTRLISRPSLMGGLDVQVALSGPDGRDIAMAPGMAAQADGSVYPNDHFTLRLFWPWQFLLGLVFSLLVISGVIGAGQKTGMLRDPPDAAVVAAPAVPAVAAAAAADGQPAVAAVPAIQAVAARAAVAAMDAPWSLGRCQMAFWFVLILVEYIMLITVSGNYNGIITAQSLTLMGIAGVTGAGAMTIDKSRPDGFTFGRSEGFFMDILGDRNGLVFHRVQMFVWTVLLGGVSLWSAWSALTLPNFDENLLILMGISSGLYLGFKAPEGSTAGG